MARMTQKMRRAEIEERMDAGMSYEAAGKITTDGFDFEVIVTLVF